MKLEEIVKYIVDNRGKNPSRTVDIGIPIIDNSLIINNKYPDIKNVKRYLDVNEANCFLRCKSIKNDLLITLVGNGYGNITLCPDNACIIQNTIGLRFHENINQEYMYYNLLNQRKRIKNLNRGASQPSIKVSDLLDTEIFIHDSITQQHIVNTNRSCSYAI